ncbi:lysogenization protein HflD [Motiliproteus sp. MSK22-1]|uniref:lysogenization protein HflD n=1 Tax=Motiliproteus sp. MSK22-1 TaxID=1897630 RepID=UPI000978C6D1|nr:lysogenization regulator HflD [Motiliproteus sp. MSK22-1]OMH32832.1 lysogenization protein HflD [Motiliproteus sp. MSK22-1]
MSREHSRKTDQQAIALAGVFQAAALVDQIAKRGLIPQNSFETSINSIFMTSPAVTEDVYGGVEEIPFGLSMGLKSLLDLAEKTKQQNKDITRYALSMLHLENRLRKHPTMLSDISDGLDKIRNQSRYFEETSNRGTSHTEVALESQTDNSQLDQPQFCHPTVVAAVAQLYQDTLSTFSFRIQVTGEPRHLQNSDNANKVRALLLAGIRAAILWRQVGGKRWQLLLFRSRVGKSARRILEHG